MPDKAEKTSRRKSSKDFREALRDGGVTPSGLLLEVMRAEETPQADKVAIAKHLTQFELPRLNAIEAENVNVEKTHEEWLRELDDEDED